VYEWHGIDELDRLDILLLRAIERLGNDATLTALGAEVRHAGYTVQQRDTSLMALEARDVIVGYRSRVGSRGKAVQNWRIAPEYLFAHATRPQPAQASLRL
jgi:hypothetical protein